MKAMEIRGKRWREVMKEIRGDDVGKGERDGVEVGRVGAVVKEMGGRGKEILREDRNGQERDGGRRREIRRGERRENRGK